jgi:hypothetical protein
MDPPIELVNRCTFSLKKYASDYESARVQINGGGNANDILNSIFKKKTKDVPFVKCPVNPQQTSFQYVRLLKKQMTIRQVIECIHDFYRASKNTKTSRLYLESTMSIENDVDNVVQTCRNRFDQEYRWHGTCWAAFLGQNRRFGRMTRTQESGYTVYVLEMLPLEPGFAEEDEPDIAFEEDDEDD